MKFDAVSCKWKGERISISAFMEVGKWSLHSIRSRGVDGDGAPFSPYSFIDILPSSARSVLLLWEKYT